MNDAFHAHLQSGTTTLCRLWSLVRRDGQVLGFTDHDRDLTVGGQVFRAGSGLTASALEQSSGLSVDNSEAVGALSDAAINEADLAAGRFDGAELRIWLANWAAPAERREIFRGTLGEVIRRGGGFRAELRGLAEALNQETGLAYTRNCGAVLGDGRCRFDTTRPGYAIEIEADEIDAEGRIFGFAALPGFDPNWFDGGRFEVLGGAGAGLVAMIKGDRMVGAGRRVELWQAIRAGVRPGDMLRLVAGCDKLPGTCRAKFGNFENFRGFPHLPGDDWLTSYPRGSDGG
ncbi:DUF2163 domain-containing protein [Pseudogemmobacter sonorensis]|uniref:DUF2163 domain-containing protein n=1 Tax=Pseudogemmobacter sonorensis TaxID=2989681 RepID=UPI00369386B9